MTPLKPFQKKTVEAALQEFRAKRRIRRFLVADEVGLGKTVVAQHIISNMAHYRKEALKVLYVCSNLSIATQNRKKLLEVLPNEERHSAVCDVDRLTLVPVSSQLTHPKLHLYTLTPDTSIPTRGGRRRDGKQEERALIHVLVKQLWPDFFRNKSEKFFRRTSTTWWDWHVRNQEENGKDKALLEIFYNSVRTEFSVEPRQWLLKSLLEFEDLEIIAKFRNALAASAIENIQPDLVIFDEFQRFRDLLDENIDDAASRIICHLRGDSSETSPPALLMLSATPYSLFTHRHNDAEIRQSHHKQFFDLVDFLYGRGAKAKRMTDECSKYLMVLENELRKGELKSQKAIEARQHLYAMLHPIMARTERANHPDGWIEHQTTDLKGNLKDNDLKTFKHFSDSLDTSHRSSACSYWLSIPLPMQTMGKRYVVWEKAKSARTVGVPKITVKMRKTFKKLDYWPHPKLRALNEFCPPQKLALPWVAPSLPWWSLDDDWAKYTDSPGKVLIFSRFRAIPQTIAAFQSYSLESSLFADSKSKIYNKITKQRNLSAGPSKHNLLGHFHPSPWLISATDPMIENGKKMIELRKLVKKQICASLNALGLDITDEGFSRPVWEILAQIEKKAGNWDWVIKNWEDLHNELSRTNDPDAGLGKLLHKWKEVVDKDFFTISTKELSNLTDYALSAPGIVVGRALQRHWSSATSSDGFYHTLKLSWSGLRNYFDQQWFMTALGGENDNFLQAIHKAIISGNLEAVLDEHIWISKILNSYTGPELAQSLCDALSLRTSDYRIHPLGGGNGTFSLRCHASMPFTEARSISFQKGKKIDRPLRTDELRKAFNSPFWPHVLTTTSVGQEGLDFHVWCSSMIHWDLCRNPVDLEQREGRIQRFGGFSIRRSIANQLGEQALSKACSGQSPWAVLGKMADEELADDSGLRPWWVCSGAEIDRFVIDLPASEQEYRLKWVKKQRMLYRLALGQPNQEDLLEFLSQNSEIDTDTLRGSLIQLSPWFNEAN